MKQRRDKTLLLPNQLGLSSGAIVCLLVGCEVIGLDGVGSPAAASPQRASKPTAAAPKKKTNKPAVVPQSSVEPVYSVVSPLGDSTVQKSAMAPRLNTLDGKTVAMVWNHSFKADITFPAIEE